MARKRRAPSPAPPPPPPAPQESSTEYESGTEEEEEEEGSPRVAATQKPPPENPQSHPPAAAAAAYSSSEEDDSDAGADGFEMIPVSRSPPNKPAAPGIPPKPGHDEEEADESSESEPEVPEPVVRKKVAATKKSKSVEQEDYKKRPAPEPAPAGKAKKAKAEAGKPAPVATPPGKGKKAKSEPEKAAPQRTPGKAKKPLGKLDSSGLDSPPQSGKSMKSPGSHRTVWSKEDLMKILEALAAHVKSEGAMPKTDVLLASLGDRLDRKDCSYTDLYEKVRNLKKRYEKQVSNGDVLKKEDELQMYKLSEAIWGEKAKEAIAAAASQSETKSKKGQAKKEKMDGNSNGGEVANQNGDTQKGSKKRQTIEAKTDRDVKTKLLQLLVDTATGSPSKSKKQENDKDKSGKNKDSKSGTSKEAATTVSQNGDALTKRKRGKTDKEKMDIDLMPKDSLTGSQNGGTRTEEEIHDEDIESGADIHATIRTFNELLNLYPNLAVYVERIKAHHPCGQTLRRAFGSIGDVKANALELKIKAQLILELKAEMREDAVRKEVFNSLIGMAS